MTRLRIAAVLLVIGSIAAGLVRADAASMNMTSADLTVFAPGELPPVCTPGSQTIVADKDTWVYEGAPTTNGDALVGSNLDLFVQSRDSSRDARALLSFPLPSFSSECVLASATLRLYNESPTSGRTINVLQVSGSWNETSVTWNDQPATTGSAAGSASPSSAGYQTWGVRDLVAAMYSGSNHGFLVRDSVENSSTQRTQVYRSREDGNGTPPELVVSWDDPSAPPPPSCTPGSQTVTADKDTWVYEGAPTTNGDALVGSNVDLFVQSRDGSRDARALLSFPLPSIPAECSLSGATLRFYNEAPTSSRTIDVYQLGGAWNETTVTWNTQPATSGSAAQSVTTSTAGYQTWTVTTQVSAMYAGTNHGFLVRDNSEGSGTQRLQTYRSREDTGGTPPELVVSWS